MKSVAAVASLLLGQAQVGTSVTTCAQDGSDYSYSESIDGDSRMITTNHCPNHPYYNLNPNVAVKEDTEYELPAKPVYVGESTDKSTSSANIDLSQKGGAVGVLLNGAMLFSPYGGPSYGQVTAFGNSATYAEGNTFDQCGCHPSKQDEPSYHCHVPPSCLLQQLGQTDSAHSPQVGWALDGFPVYGPRGPGGVMMQTCTQTNGTYGTDTCTDDCGGFYKTDSSIDNFVYRYYILGTYNDGTSCDLPGCPSPTAEYYPNTPVCYRGCCPDGVSCSSSITKCSSLNSGTSTSNGYTDDYAATGSVLTEQATNTGGCTCGNLACSATTCSSQAWSTKTCGTGDGSNDCSASAAGAERMQQTSLLAGAVVCFAAAVFLQLAA